MKTMALYFTLLATVAGMSEAGANCGPKGCGFFFQMGFNGGFNQLPPPTARPLPGPGFARGPQQLPFPNPMPIQGPAFPPMGGIGMGPGIPPFQAGVGMPVPMPMPIGTHGGFPQGGFVGGGFVAGGGAVGGARIVATGPIRANCRPRGCEMSKPCKTVRCRPKRGGCFGRGRRC